MDTAVTGTGEEAAAAPEGGEPPAATPEDGRLRLGWRGAGSVALFAVTAAFVVLDLAADWASGIRGLHAVVEVAALGVALVGVYEAISQLRRFTRRTRDLQQHLRRTQEDLDRWRSEAQALLERLGTALDRQFERWGLTPAESEIALFVLKGLSYREIASARGTTERTVRHQALAIYRKAGFAGRAEMAAFFLQDLLLPARPERAPDVAALGARLQA